MLSWAVAGTVYLGTVNTTNTDILVLMPQLTPQLVHMLVAGTVHMGTMNTTTTDILVLMPQLSPQSVHMLSFLLLPLKSVLIF